MKKKDDTRPQPTTPKRSVFDKMNQWLDDNVSASGKNVRAQSVKPKTEDPDVVKKAKAVKSGYDKLKDTL
ncbi:MAG: hypothetical protein NVSMB14_17890 [Isosphaeraceae bacterium]